MGKLFFISILITLGIKPVLAQPQNDNCIDASSLCANQTITGTTLNATVVNCGMNCEDDLPGSFGFSPSNSVWYKFTTNDVFINVAVEFTNLTFNPDPNKGQALQAVIFEASTPCQGQSFIQKCNPEQNGITDFTLTTAGLTANTTYYIIANGSNIGAGVTEPADVTFDISISGAGVEVLLPDVSISTPLQQLCQGETIPITETILNCDQNSTYSWYFDDEFLTNDITFNTESLTESGVLKLKVSCGNECVYEGESNALFLNVTEIELNLEEEIIVPIGKPITINSSGIGIPNWTPIDFLSENNTFTPTVTANNSITYTVTVTNESCVVSKKINVNIDGNILIPSGFTPNGDHVNDIWEIINISLYTGNTVSVYDRAGQLIFFTENYTITDNNWNGTLAGEELPVSTYYYVIDLNTENDNSILKGSVSLLR